MKKQQKQLIRIGVAGAGFLALKLIPMIGEFELAGWWELGLYLALYALIGWDILWKAVRNITRGQIFDENLLMSVATVGALCLGDYAEAVAVMLFYQVGEWFQSCGGQQIPPLHCQPDGYPAGLCQCGAGRPARSGGPGGGLRGRIHCCQAGGENPAGRPWWSAGPLRWTPPL